MMSSQLGTLERLAQEQAVVPPSKALDYLKNLRYLLDERFHGVLAEPDLALRDLLRPLSDAAHGIPAQSSAWPLVEDLLARLGRRAGRQVS